jgi:DNA-binding XRE family transcriptional regulator
MRGPELREWRVSHLYTVEELAAVLGVQPVTLSRWEREERRPASWTIVALALKGLSFTHGAGCRCPMRRCRHWPDRYGSGKNSNREYAPR